jgi:hypothetical protein
MKRRVRVSGVEEYGGSHRPPDADDGAPLHDLTANGIYPADVYERPSWYDTGDKGYMEAWSLARRFRGRLNRYVQVFRALPCGNRKLHRGDWVTTVKSYAREHSKHPTDSSKDACIISKMVRASCIHTAGDSLMEWGYNCEDTDGAVVFRPRKKKVQDDR